MSDEEFQDLQNFGKTIEKIQNVKKDIKVELKQKEIKKIKIFDKEKLGYFVKKIFKNMIFTKIRLAKHCKNLFFKMQKLKKIKNVSLKRQKNYVKCYRLVERRKQRRNKTIIVRRRMPFKIGFEDIGLGRSDLENLIHLTFESGVYFNTERPSTSDHKLKESVWDFKIK